MNRNPYPCSGRLRDDLNALVDNYTSMCNPAWDFKDLIDCATVYMKEYEHGTANAQDLGSTLMGMENVLRDFLTTLQDRYVERYRQ